MCRDRGVDGRIERNVERGRSDVPPKQKRMCSRSSHDLATTDGRHGFYKGQAVLRSFEPVLRTYSRVRAPGVRVSGLVRSRVPRYPRPIVFSHGNLGRGTVLRISDFDGAPWIVNKPEYCPEVSMRTCENRSTFARTLKRVADYRVGAECRGSRVTEDIQSMISGLPVVT